MMDTILLAKNPITGAKSNLLKLLVEKAKIKKEARILDIIWVVAALSVFSDQDHHYDFH